MDEPLYLDTEATASKTSAPRSCHHSQRHSKELSCTGVSLPSSGVQSPPIFPGRVHYKERLVELVNHFRCDPVVLFSPAEMRAELQRWNVVVPSKSLDEPEPLYVHRLRLVSDAPAAPKTT